MESQQLYQTIDTQILDTTADCIKFCPFPEYNKYFLIAFYQLNEELQQSFGGMRAYIASDKIEEVQRVESGGVLDFQWIPTKIDGQIYFVAAQCDSIISIYKFDIQNNPENPIQKVKEMNVEEPLKCLYTDAIVHNDILYIITGTDVETIEIIQINIKNNFDVVEQETIQKHEFSVWACAVSPQNPDYQYLSGGDDCKLRLYDTRLPNKIALLNKNSHMQGITTIVFSPHDSNIFATGSYDEHIRLFDIRAIQNEVFDSKRAGGVWRTIFDKNNKDNILCGTYSEHYFEILNYNNNASVVQKLDGHESLAYSCDYSLDSQFIATCSFYDKKINLWKKN